MPAEAQDFNNNTNDTATTMEGGEVESSASETNESLPQGEGYAIQVNPSTGEKEFVRYNSEEEENVEENVEENAEDTSDYGEGYSEAETTPQEESNGQYSADELALAIQFGQVDESRIPPQYVGQYINYKTQLMQQTMAQQQQTVEEQPNPQANAQDEIAQIRQKAYDLALEQMGLTSEEVDLLEYSDEPEKAKDFQIAFQNNVNNILIARQEHAMAMRQNEQARQEIYNDVKAFTEDCIKNEPNFQAIDKLMLTRYQSLPFKEALPLAQALEAFKNGNATREQLPLLVQYYNDTKAEYYANKNGLSTKPRPVKRPPVVERAGQGTEPQRESIDWSLMRGMSKKDRMAFLTKNFRR